MVEAIHAVTVRFSSAVSHRGQHSKRAGSAYKETKNLTVLPLKTILTESIIPFLWMNLAFFLILYFLVDNGLRS
jgi:hypothetical protein